MPWAPNFSVQPWSILLTAKVPAESGVFTIPNVDNKGINHIEPINTTGPNQDNLLFTSPTANLDTSYPNHPPARLLVKAKVFINKGKQIIEGEGNNIHPNILPPITDINNKPDIPFNIPTPSSFIG